MSLKVATRNSPLAYYEGAAGPEGPEYELARAFAERLGVRLEITLAKSAAAALAAVAHNRAHIAAAGLIAHGGRKIASASGRCFSASISTSSTGCRTSCRRRRPTWLAGVSWSCAIQRHATSLARLAPQWPGLEWTEVKGGDTLDLLARVAEGKADVTVADSIEFSLGRHFHPDLRPAFKLSESEAVAWALSPHGEDLLSEVGGFFAEMESSGRLADILERNRRALVRFDRVDAANFVAGVRERLPRYQAWFQEAAAETGIDWRLLAAIGYQESRWDEAAVSPTGVQGLMMLTADTARARRRFAIATTRARASAAAPAISGWSKRRSRVAFRSPTGPG